MKSAKAGMFVRRFLNGVMALLPIPGVLVLGWNPAAVIAYFLLEMALVEAFFIIRCVVALKHDEDTEEGFKYALMPLLILIVGGGGVFISKQLAEALLHDVESFFQVFVDQPTLWPVLAPALFWHGWLFKTRFLDKRDWPYNDAFHYLAYPMAWATLPSVAACVAFFIPRNDLLYAVLCTTAFAALELSFFGYLARQYYDETLEKATDVKVLTHV